MSAKWFKVELSITLFGVWINLCTPDWSRECHRPSWRPRFALDDFQKQGIPCESRYMLHMDWFFHLTAAWGKNAAQWRDPDEPITLDQPIVNRDR